MWNSTEIMAKQIAEGIISAGSVDVKIFNISTADKTDVMKEMLDAKGFLIGSSTHGNDMLPNILGFLAFVKDMKPKGRIGGAFGSYGWAGGAVASIEKVLKESGIEVAQAGLGVRFVPDEAEMKKCFEFGKEFAGRV